MTQPHLSDLTPPITDPSISQEQALAQRTLLWTAALNPTDAFQTWLVQELCESTLDTETLRTKLNVTRNRLANELAVDWDDQRMIAIERLVADLDDNPALVVRQLRMTPHGCDWMIDRWQRLAGIYDRKFTFHTSEQILALNLLGTPTELRGYSSELNSKTKVKDLIEAQLAALADRRASRVAFDAAQRQIAVSGQGLALEETDEMVQIRKELATSEKRTRWAWARLAESRRASKSTAKNEVEAETTPEAKPIKTFSALVSPVEVGPALTDAMPSEPELKAEPQHPDTIPTSDPNHSQSINSVMASDAEWTRLSAHCTT